MNYLVTNFPEDGWFGSSTGYGASQHTFFTGYNSDHIILVGH